MYKEVLKNDLIDELKSYEINYELTIWQKDNKVKKIHKTEIESIDINNVKSVQFFIKKKNYSHLALVKVIKESDEDD